MAPCKEGLRIRLYASPQAVVNESAKALAEIRFSYFWSDLGPGQKENLTSLSNFARGEKHFPDRYRTAQSHYYNFNCAIDGSMGNGGRNSCPRN
jgi:hypothetical protein